MCDACGATDFVHRPDDRPEAVATRFEVYHRQTAPILPYYRARHILSTVDGMGEMDAVTRQIEASEVTYIYYQFVSVTGRVMGKGIPAGHWAS